MKNGYFGNVLWIYLNQKSFTEENIEESSFQQN